MTPLHYAVLKNQFEMVKYLLEQPGIDLTIKSKIHFLCFL